MPHPLVSDEVETSDKQLASRSRRAGLARWASPAADRAPAPAIIWAGGAPPTVIGAGRPSPAVIGAGRPPPPITGAGRTATV
eukprot:300571-Chlamydomonas_euryale.AAC.15